MILNKYAFMAGIFAVASANAGQIQIGSGVNGADGLTSSYITSAGNWSQRPYQSNLFSGVTLTSAAPAVKTNTSGVAAAPGQQTLTDANGVNFALINQSVAAGADFNYVWASTSSTSTAPTALTVPIGIGGVTSVYVLLNDYSGYFSSTNPYNDAIINFNFSTGTDSIHLVDLINGTGAIRSSVECTSTSGTTITCPSTTANGNTVSASDPSQTNTNIYGDATIKTSAVWRGTYAQGATSGVNNPYFNANGGSSGNLMIDELQFTFSTNYSGAILNSISLSAPTGSTGNALGTMNERLALSAVTVVTPEPSTMFLFATGLGLLGFGRRRAKK